MACKLVDLGEKNTRNVFIEANQFVCRTEGGKRKLDQLNNLLEIQCEDFLRRIFTRSQQTNEWELTFSHLN